MLEQRGMRAADLFRRGVSPAEIARRLGVSHQIVSEWRKAWRQGGRAALRSAGPVGRPRKLTQAYKAGQSAQAIRLQPAMQRPTWDLSLARQLRKWHAVFEVVPQQHKPLDRVISLRLTQLGE